MKSIKLLSLIAVLGLFANTVSVSASCCTDAKKAGKECTHKCCVEATKNKKTCEKCNKPEPKK